MKSSSSMISSNFCNSVQPLNCVATQLCVAFVCFLSMALFLSFRWFFLSRPCRFGMWGGISRRPVILCQTIAVLTAIVVSCIFVITLVDWFVVAMSKWRMSTTRETIAEVPVTDFSDSSLSFGIVIDGGSSGSRLFVYCWPPHDGEPGRLLNIRLMLDSNSNPVVMKIEPGDLVDSYLVALNHKFS
jgi:GDA1/CD39 (nucleoside phosphatase) family